MADTTPVWAWLPGMAEPIEAARLDVEAGRYRFRYGAAYKQAGRDGGSVALDPFQLRLNKQELRTDTLPGVLMDARPAGYGQDRLNAQWQASYQRDLNDIELLELGPADGVGAIEVCRDIDRKRSWVAPDIDGLQHELERLEDDAPPSRAMRRANGDVGTSAGGERPKATFVFDRRLWLVKMQDRGDRQGMPALEYTVMSLATQARLHTAPVLLRTVGPHQVLLVERFDRSGDPRQPLRTLYASAHTVLQLPPAAVAGHPLRSYLVLADKLRVWGRDGGHDALALQLQELWRRMAFNALVGNIDDHPRNHGLRYVDGAWRLTPAFDITPIWKPADSGRDGAPTLAMATGADGLADASPERLLAAAGHFGLSPEEAADYLLQTSRLIAGRWEALLSEALAPLASHRAGVSIAAIIDQARGAFSLSDSIVQAPAAVERAVEQLLSRPRSGRRRSRE